ncbi:MAG: L-aspartate oxidase [Paracoccaceae bacterium]
MTHTNDRIVIGAGLAGLFTALRIARHGLPVTVVAPAPLGEGACSAWAQGGIAAALRGDDSPDAHAADTVAAGAGLVEAAVAAAVAADAPARIADLLALGVPFDRDVSGALCQSREAAHSARRVVRVKGDMAGAAIMQAVVAAIRAAPEIRVIEGTAEALATDGGRVTGVWVRQAGRAVALPARAVVLATGGIGGLYAATSNPLAVAGQGLGMAARAGARIRDAEFVQFHPTGLAVDQDPAPLASEALRGEGAILVDEAGTPLMAGTRGGDLAPRDVVALTLFRHIRAGGRVFLDTRAAIGRTLPERFPTVTAAARAAGIDPVSEPIPVRPVQHYHMGGIATDARGRSSLPGLWAVGEVAATGLHGANRLASNSLLEAVVYGARAAADLAETADAEPGPMGAPPAEGPVPRAALASLRETMDRFVGVERSDTGLRQALARFAEIDGASPGAAWANTIAVARLVAVGALLRRESRGAHQRTDFPDAATSGASTRLTLAEARAAIAAAGLQAAA